MRRWRKYILFLIIAISTGCCVPINDDAICPIGCNTECVTINIDSAKSVESFFFSSLLEPPCTIVLESSDRCVIRNIHSIDIYENNIYILDDVSNKLFVFGIDGSFLYCIGHRGKGRGEYTELSDFSIDKEKGCVYLWDPVTKTALKYDIHKREYITSIKMDIGGYDSYSLMFYNEKLYVNRTSIEMDSENYLLSEIEESSGKELAKYLRASEYNHGWNFPLRLQYGNFYLKNTSSPIFVELFTDTIVSFTKEGVRPMYVIRSDDFVKDKDINKFIEHCNENRDYNIFNLDSHLIFMPQGFMDMGNHVLFEMMSAGRLFYVLYNKETKETQKSPLFTNDYVSSECYVAANMIFCDGNSVISVLTNDFIPYFEEEIVANGLLNKDIDKYDDLTQLNETSNPVLFYYKCKKYK